jgi:hypothetical protein
MVQKQPPTPEDPTIDQEAPEFDGSRTDQLDNTYRLRLVIASEPESGSASEETGIFDQAQAVEIPDVEENLAPLPTEPLRKLGYDPYDTGIFKKPKSPR